MIDHCYEVHFHFPPSFGDISKKLNPVRFSCVPHVGDSISFGDLELSDGSFVEFEVASRHLHVREGAVEIISLVLKLRDEPGIVDVGAAKT